MGAERLKSRGRFKTVCVQGRSWASAMLVLRALPNGLGRDRYGVSVSRRVGNAVVRNRAKRLIREAARQMPTKQGWDLVFIARRPVAGADYHTVKRAVGELLARAQLLDEGSGGP
ncbi:MAG: ribonuclease P protein component [Chloroflexota bacterium]|nr:ribonuclease P protein component [Chloroflexota bacterium]